MIPGFAHGRKSVDFVGKAASPAQSCDKFNMLKRKYSDGSNLSSRLHIFQKLVGSSKIGQELQKDYSKMIINEKVDSHSILMG